MAATFSDWLIEQLDASLAKQPTDALKKNWLRRQHEGWTERFRQFEASQGASLPPHPQFGVITLWEFNTVLTTIGTRLSALQQKKAA